MSGPTVARRAPARSGRARAPLTALLLALVAAGGCGAAHPAGDPRPAAADVAGLPLVEVPAVRPGGRTLALLMTGDGGWAPIDRGVAAELSARGVAVVGFNSRTYLDRRRTPDETAADVSRALRHYAAAWDRDSIAIVGYSRGADFAPFVANRLPPDLKARLALIAMLGPDANASFEFHWSDLVSDTHRPSDLPTAPEIARLRGAPTLCVFGADEPASPCRSTALGHVRSVERKGGHHFDGDYRALGDLIADALGAKAAPPAPSPSAKATKAL
jgi:type IV secretory pathway VirJ component